MELKILVAALTIVAVLVVSVEFYFFSGASAQTSSVSASDPPVPTGGVQKVSLRALSSGVYDKPSITVQKGVPVELTFSADDDAGCGHTLIIRDFGVQISLQAGQSKTVTFTPDKVGSFEYSCSMRMFRGTLIVKG
ncbi:MAG: cupredoxin domain-containing protein [Candidatus Diapherotrites archaeon]